MGESEEPFPPSRGPYVPLSHPMCITTPYSIIQPLHLCLPSKAFIEPLLCAQDAELDRGGGAAALSQLVVQGWEGSVVFLALTAEFQYQHPQPRLRHPACLLLHPFCHPGGVWGRGGEIGELSGGRHRVTMDEGVLMGHKEPEPGAGAGATQDRKHLKLFSERLAGRAGGRKLLVPWEWATKGGH